MLILDRSRTVALLIDYDNLQICAQRDAPGSDLDLRSVMALAQRFGRVVVARAYAEWNSPNERLEAYKAGIEPTFAPVLRTQSPGGQEGKSLADTVIVSEGVDLMWSYSPDVYVLVTSDKDLIPLVRLVKQRGSKVVVLGSDLTAVPLREMADEFWTYRRLVHELTGVVLGGGQPGTRAGGQRQQRGTYRDRPAPTPLPQPPPAVAAPRLDAVDERPGVAEPVALTSAEATQEERLGQAASRRRRRRGGRNRGRTGQPGAAEGSMEAAATEEVEVGLEGGDHAEHIAEVIENGELPPTVEPPPAPPEAPRFAMPELDGTEFPEAAQAEGRFEDRAEDAQAEVVDGVPPEPQPAEDQPKRPARRRRRTTKETREA